MANCGVAVQTEAFLLERYTPLVRRIAFSLKAMQPQALERDDAVQDGMLGLLRAIRTNRHDNASADARFASFARISIRGAIIDGYRVAGDFSRSDYTKAKKTRRAVTDGLPVCLSEQGRAEHLLASAWAETVDIADETGEAGRLADPVPGPEQRAISNQLLRMAVDSLQRMPVRDRSIFIACELQGEKHTRVAAQFGLSSGRVSQILRAVRQEILLAIA